MIGLIIWGDFSVCFIENQLQSGRLEVEKAIRTFAIIQSKCSGLDHGAW